MIDRRTFMSSLTSALAALAAAGVRSAERADEVSPLTRRLSTYIAQAAQTPIPDAVTEAAKQHLLDTLAAMISGTRLPPGRTALAWARTQVSAREACIPGSRLVTNVVTAALAGGMLAHADETDDTHPRAVVHLGASTVPAALAMAELHNAGGTAFLRAVALGYDIGSRAELALGGQAFRASGFNMSGYGGTFGAAAAAASLAGFDAEQVRYVLSYAAQQASGISDFARDREHIEKAFLFGGMPARNGVTAAILIASGMTGVADAFSGENNFFVPFGAKTKPEELVRELGTTYEIVDTTIKKWSVGAPAQLPLDVLYDFVKTQNVKAAEVEKVVIRTDAAGAHLVSDREMPDITLQYLAAVMLLDGTVSFDAAHDMQRMREAKVMNMRRRIELVGDESMGNTVATRRASVELKLRDGRELRQLASAVRGSPANPMTRDEVEAKALQLMAPVLGKKRAHDLAAAVWRIERLGSVRALRPLLRG